MTKDQFLARKSPVKEITLHDGTPAYIRKLSQAETEHVRKTYGSQDKALEGFRYLVCKCLVTADGTRVFADGDAASLAAVEYDDVETIVGEVMEFSGLNRVRDPKKP